MKAALTSNRLTRAGGKKKIHLASATASDTRRCPYGIQVFTEPLPICRLLGDYSEFEMVVTQRKNLSTFNFEVHHKKILSKNCILTTMYSNYLLTWRLIQLIYNFRHAFSMMWLWAAIYHNNSIPYPIKFRRSAFGATQLPHSKTTTTLTVT